MDREQIFEHFRCLVPDYFLDSGFLARWEKTFPNRHPTDGFGLPIIDPALLADPIFRFAKQLKIVSSWQRARNLFTFRNEQNIGGYEDLIHLAARGRHFLSEYVERPDFVRIASVRRLRSPFRLVEREQFAGYLKGPPEVPVFDRSVGYSGDWNCFHVPESVRTWEEIKAQTDFGNEWLVADFSSVAADVLADPKNLERQIIIVLWPAGDQQRPEDVLLGLVRNVWDALPRIGREIGCEVELPQRPRQLSGMDLFNDLFDKLDEWHRRVRHSDPAFAEYCRGREFLSQGLPYTPSDSVDRGEMNERVTRELGRLAIWAGQIMEYPCKRGTKIDGSDLQYDADLTLEAVRELFCEAAHWLATVGEKGPDAPVAVPTVEQYRMELLRLAEWCRNYTNRKAEESGGKLPFKPGFLSADELAELFGLEAEATRKKLERHSKQFTDCFIELEGRRHKEPRRLYRVVDVENLLKKG